MRKNIISWTLTVSAMISVFSPMAHATSTCENVFNDVPEFEVLQAEVSPGVNLEYRKVFHKDREFHVSEVLGKTDDLLLGIAPFGHAYLVSGSVRLDGTVLGRKTTVNDHMAELETGIVIKIKKQDMDKTRLKKFDDTYGVSCGKTACEAMAKAGDLYIGANKSAYYSPHEMVQAIFKEGIRDGAGNVVPFEVYYIGKFDLVNTLKRVQSSSDRIKKEVVTKYGVIATGMTTITASLLYFLGYFDEDSQKSSAIRK
ncbi:hypothetical protein ACLSU7_08510 [Bdellovibrio sp. HCB185ZH]|uniref:hypothetical protein n=1 Tax=Bdellovibrio sp. HCB185ZH TaxID=3394235 RepID=UPI0039A4856F